ncbi:MULTISPECIES: phage major capsid protein [Ehrlichia]|uniref:Phage major capsid protein, HK97 family n=1 Tax=Ehrlichia cf. muris str. EmCRT TaxID=1359167 RepID=A0A0F3NDS2_9RICK|nr:MULTISPECIES: phage major capsid protein [Ehrlichia]KJV65867.1 phage major capsid protein, HK97 family [Ehrlichia cf. muris str. EmCRT]OUC04109.1 phage capsid protein [Ehrlichia sp. Wisconsin_h]
MPTSMPAIQESLSNLISSWEEFKTLNEKKLSDIRKKSSTYPSILEKLEKTESMLETQNERLDQLEISSQRPIIYDNKHYNEDHNYKIFTQYLCKGNNITDQSTVTQPLDESYFIPHNISSYIEKNLTKNSVMRQLCSIEKISGDNLDCFITNNNEKSVNWRTDSNVEDTESPKIDKIIITLHELYAQPKITKKLLEDSTIDVASWLINHLVDDFSRAENTAFISGDGNNKPYGILTYASDTENNLITSPTLSSDIIIKLYYSLDEYFSRKAAFIMHRSVLQEIRSLKLASGQYIWHPGLTSGSPDTLMGLPVYQTSDMPQLDNKILPIIALADFTNAYKIVENRSIKTLRDPFTSKSFVKFYTTKRVGGAVINKNAIRYLTIDPTKT